MEGECETTVRRRESWGIPVINREIIDLLRASVKLADVTSSGDMHEVHKENTQTLKSCPGKEGRVAVGGSGPWELWNGISDLGCLHWKCEPREWISTQSLTQKCQQDQLLAVSCFKKRSEAVLRPTEAPDYAEEQKARILVGGVADGHNADARLVASCSSVVHLEQQMGERTKRLEACMEKRKNELSVVASDFGEKSIVLEEVSQEIRETEMTLCRILTGDKNIQRQWKEMIPQKSTTHGDKVQVGTRAITEPVYVICEGQECVLSNPLELGTKISYMPETEGQKEEQRNYLNGTWQVCKVSRHAASDEALGQHELCRSSRASCPTEPLGLMEALVQLQYQPFSQEQLMNDIDKGVQATPNLEQAARCCCEDRCSILGGHERERRDRTTQGSVVLAQVGAQNGSVKSRLKANTSDPQARDTEPTGLLSDLSMDSEDKEDACIQETWDLDAQLWRGRGELHACEKERWIQNRCQLLEEEGQEWRPTGSIPTQRSRARGAALSEQSQNSQQSLVPDKELASAKEKKTQRSQQQEPPALQSSVKHLQEDLELAWRERGISPPEELDTQVTPDLQVLFQRVKVLEHSLGDNVSIFMASEEALKNRIEELEASERKLLVRVKDLMEQAAGQSAAVSRQRQEERLHTLREDMQSMRMEKERSERLWKERLRRCQEQLRTKEEEMKMQGDYFEHFKLKQQQKLSLAREREHALQRRVYELEREAVDLMTTATLLRAELVRQPCGEPPEQEGWEEERDKLNMFISSLQQDLRELLGHEEVGQEERQALLERLQAAEDNGEFLSHRLEDLRSRVQQLRLSEGRLLDELEELAKENVQLHRGHQTLPGAESGLQEAVPEDGNKQPADMAAIEKQLQLKREAALDPARSKGAQTPSMTQCIQEAIMVSKLIPALSRSQSCSYEGVLEISFLPLLETNSLGLAEIMQTLRCGGEEQAQQNMEQLELRKVLVSQPGVVNHTQNEEGALSSQKGVMAVQSLPDLLKLFGNKFQNSNLISLVSKTIDVDCNSMDNDLPATGLSCRSYTCDRCKLTNEEIKLLNEDVLRLQAEIGSLRDNKNELESVVRSKEEAMRRLLEEIVQLKRIGAKSCSSGVSYQDPVLLSCEKDELHLETLKHNWRQENEALFRRNEELLGQLARLEGDHEQELVRLRLQVTMLEKEVVRLEEENKEHCCAVEEDQKVIKELQDTLWIRNEEVGTLCQKQKEDMALIAELWETQGAKTEQSMLLEDVTSHISYDASAGNLKEPQVEESKEMQKEQQKAFRMSSDAPTLRNEGSQEVTSPRSDNSTLSIIMSTSVEGKNLKEEGPPDTGMTIDGIQQHPVLKDHLGANNVVKRSVQKARVVFRFSREPQKLQECTPAREVDVSPQNIKVTQKSHTTHYSYKTVNLGRTLQERPNVTGELNNVRKELAATVADLQQSQEYLDRAKTEAQKWYRELGLAESRREEAEKKASQALNELKRMKRCLKESEGMKKEHNELKDEVEELRRQMVHLEKEHINAVSMRTRLEEKLVSLLTCLDVKCGTEDELRAKNLALEGCESALESWCDTVKKLKAHYDDIKYQFEELRKLKTQCDLDTAPLKAKLACVVQKCRERNSLIVQLVRARRRCGCIHRSLMQEAEDLVNDTALLEYSSAFGPAAAAVQLTQDNLRESLEAGRPDNAEGPWFNSHGSLMEKHTPLSYRLCVAKTDYCPSPDMPQTALPILPLSAGEEVQVAGVPDGRGLCHAEVKGEAGLVPARFLEEKDASEQSPASGSETAGPLPKLTGPEKILEVHHQLQQLHRSNYQILPLAECSSTPELGHFSASAQFQSQHALRGLSKASGVSRSTPPFHKKGEMRRGEQQEPQQETKSVFAEPVGTAAKDTTVILNISPPRADVCRAAAKDHLPDRANMAASPDAPSPEDRPIRAKLDPPAPVVSLKVTKTVGQSGLMIGWERPPLDELGCSNGTFVCGYRVYVDGEFHKYVMSSACTKAVLENLDLSVPVHISVQTLGSNGLLAEKVHILFEGSWPPAGPASTLGAPVRRWHSWTSQPVTTRAPTMEQTTLKSTTEPALCVAIYNYSPLKDSPNIHPSRELAFREGDTVWVLGEPRQDGFCEAEVNGTRGLAPVAFLEEIKSRLPSEE